MALWAIELSEFDIQYHSHTTIKGEVVTDFIAEFPNVICQGAREYPQWTIYTDESSNRWANEAGIILCSPKRDEIKCIVCLDFPVTNNETEYEVLVAGENGNLTIIFQLYS